MISIHLQQHIRYSVIQLWIKLKSVLIETFPYHALSITHHHVETSITISHHEISRPARLAQIHTTACQLHITIFQKLRDDVAIEPRDI